MIKRILQLIILTLLFQSCATFKSDLPIPTDLQKSKTELLSGKYEVISLAYPNPGGFLKYGNFIEDLEIEIPNDPSKTDSTKKKHLEIKLIDKEKLELSYIVDQKVIRKKIIKAKLKDDGYLYLKNHNVRCNFIPYIFGSFKVKRIRLYVKENDDLIIEESYFQGGAALLILFLNFGTDRYTHTYESIK